MKVLFSLLFVYFVSGVNVQAQHIPANLETVTADDESVWERVNVPGFGSEDNFSVVAMAEYNSRLYAMTRNQSDGLEVWRTKDETWEQVLFPGGETNGVYGNSSLNNVWGRMIVFKDKLYFGFSSGLQGNFLGSSGCEIWTYDGVEWAPVISDKKDTDEAGSITAIADCTAADGNTTAQLTDSDRTWTDDQWAGGTLQIVSGEGTNRKFNIISNTADTLTIQQDETSGTGADLASESEFTNCGEKTYNNMYPRYSYTLGVIETGDLYEIGMGDDENGFGDYWNKTITDMVLFNDILYVSTGLNYAYGAQIWFTEDGDSWTVTQAANDFYGGSLANSYGNYHADVKYPGGLKPVSSSLTNMAVFNDELYGGGTGTTGEKGGCSRMAKLTADGWELIVDANVDENDNGTNENGFGDGMDCVMDTGNFMPWSLTTYDGKLLAGINSLGGLRLLYTETGSADDTDGSGPTWKDSIGGDADYAEGFGDPDNLIALNLFPHGGILYGGVVMTYVPEWGFDLAHGAPLWKSDDGLVWSNITADGFGDNDTVIMEAMTDFGGTLYVSASKGASSTPDGLGGAKIYRMVTSSTLVELTAFKVTPLNKAVRISWATGAEIDNAGFNLYRAEKVEGPYAKINTGLIPAEGSSTQGVSYTYVDAGLKNRTAYYYKLEDVDQSGVATLHGPEQATPRFFAGFMKK